MGDGPLFGRDAEQLVLLSLLDAARAGRSGAVVVRGEAGLGKTALLGGLAAEADGMRVLATAGVPAEATIPFAGLHQLLHPALGEVEPAAGRPRAALERAMGLRDGTAPEPLLLGAAVLGLELRLATPESHRPALRVRKRADEIAARSGARIRWSEDPVEAVRDADFVYTDTWTSMGQEAEAEMRRSLFRPYQLNVALLAHAAPDAFVMHCLPAHRGEEITDEVLDGPRSIVFDQAENRLHAQKAVMEKLLRR